MSDEAIISAIRRKAGAGRTPPEVLPLTPEKALRRACQKAAQDQAGLKATVTAFEEKDLSTKRLMEAVPENALIALLESPTEQYGLCLFDMGAVSSVVEQKTAGRVLATPPEPRGATRTDAVMCGSVIDGILSVFEKELSGLPALPMERGFRFVVRLEEARSIGLAFEDQTYRSYFVTAEFGDVAREGQIILAFPRTIFAAETGWEPHFQAAVLGSTAKIDAVLARLQLTMADVMGFSEGHVLPLPQEADTMVELCAGDHTVAKAKLGQLGGARALRLIGEDAQDAVMEETAPALDLPPLEIPEVEEPQTFEPAEEETDLPDLPSLEDLPDLNETETEDFEAPAFDMSAFEDAG